MTDDVRLLDLRQVTWGMATHEHPVFSPDGSKIAFYAGEYGWLQIHLTGVHGTGERPLTCGKGNHTQPSFSPDGRHVYYRAQTSNEAPWALWRTTVDDPDERERLLFDPAWSFKHPSPSPDGRTLVWFSDEGTKDNFHLWRAPIGRRGLGRRERLTSDRDRNDCHPVWSPDGKRLAFHAYMGAVEATTSHVFVANADGTGARAVTSEPALHKHPFFVGPDLIVHHTQDAAGRRYVALRRAEGGALVSRLTSGKRNDKHPSPWVPPHGPVRIAFASKKRGLVLPPEESPTFDVFWGHLSGVAVPRGGART